MAPSTWWWQAQAVCQRPKRSETHHTMSRISLCRDSWLCSTAAGCLGSQALFIRVAFLHVVRSSFSFFLKISGTDLLMHHSIGLRMCLLHTAYSLLCRERTVCLECTHKLVALAACNRNLVHECDGRCVCHCFIVYMHFGGFGWGGML